MCKDSHFFFFLNWRIVKDSHKTGESEVFCDSFLHLCKGTYNNNKDKMKPDVKELASHRARKKEGKVKK